MSLSKSESDIILNRANVALSRSQRLVASWLPTQTDDELVATSKTEEELQREEDEIFTAVPETLGIGAPLPEKAADGSWNRSELSSNDLLRKQLLGRNYDRIMKANAAAQAQKSQAQAQASNSTSNSTVPGSTAAGVDVDDDDEEEGRAAMVGKKRKTGSSQSMSVSADQSGTPDGDGGQKQSSASSGRSARGKKKATSYLDEILAQRANKKKKR